MLDLLAPICGGLAVFFAIYTLVTPAAYSRVHERLDRLGRPQALTERDEQLARPLLERTGLSGGRWLRSAAGKLLPGAVAADIEARLRRAGEPTSLHGFVLMQMTALGIAAVIVVGGLSFGFTGIFAAVIIGVAGAITTVPFLWLDSAAGNRRKAIQKALPDAADLIVTMVEAGMSIDGALAKVSTQTNSPLADELRFTTREITLGRGRQDALMALVSRVAVPELRSFVQAIVHAQNSGVPLGQVLRTQASEIRLKKRQRAEEAARKAPVKVLLVLIFFIMPALLLTLLGPAVIRAGNLS